LLQRKEAEQWFRTALGNSTFTLVHRDSGPGFTDDPRFDGPTIVSLETLKTVEKWLNIDDAGDRFRPNIVVGGVDAFWEDLLVGEDETCGSVLKIGGTEIVAAFPVHRCVVPSRGPANSDNPGKDFPKFIEKFQELRKTNYIDGAPAKRLSSAKVRPCYHLCTSCVISKAGSIFVGDSVNVQPRVPLQPVVRAAHKTTTRSLINLVNGAYAIREIHQYERVVALLAIALLPTEIAAKIITQGLWSVRQPTTAEVLFGVIKLVLTVVGLFMLFKVYWV